MAAPVITPLLQWSDANGHPYAGGSIATYMLGTSTPKATYLDPGLTALNTNPVVLDAAGRSTMFGDGDFRLVLHDAAGNLIADFPATTIVSAAMEPVVSAPTIADAQALLGITGFATSADLASAINTEQTARINADNAEITARTNADNAEITARTNADNNLQSQITKLSGGPVSQLVQSGHSVTSSAGSASITFATAYTTTPAVVATVQDTALADTWFAVSPSTSGFNILASQPSGGTVVGVPCSFFWIAAGT